MILIGSISQQFMDLNRIFFAIGACCASFVWFFGIAYGAKLLTPIMQKPSHWRIFDLLIALIMFIIAFNLASQGNWV
jgi:L-lysine exporter family protein LysE/ArgO